jgi:hypothetical protein
VCPSSTNAFAFKTLVETLEQEVFVGSGVVWRDVDLLRLALCVPSWPGAGGCGLPAGANNWLQGHAEEAAAFASALLRYMSPVVQIVSVVGQSYSIKEPIEQVSPRDPWVWTLSWDNAPCSRVRVDVDESGVCVVEVVQVLRAVTVLERLACMMCDVTF